MDGLIDVKRKGIKSIGCWANYVTLTFDHTHDLDHGFSRSHFEIAVLTWNERDVSRSFMSVTTMGWADVPDSDRGDFRCRRAVDRSS